MHSNRIWIPILIVAIVSGLIIGLFFILGSDEPKDPNPSDTTAPDFIVIEPNYQFGHTQGNTVIDFVNGNEKFLDESLVAYIERMENGTPALDENGNYYYDKDGDIVYDTSEQQHVKGVLDNLITLINRFAEKEYTAEASHQVQRFYIKNYPKFLGADFEKLIRKIEACIPGEGADPLTAGETVFQVFGYNSGDGCAYLFEPFRVAEINVDFSSVRPSDITLTDMEELLCIYNYLKSEEDDGYERNLEAWLHHVVKAVSESELDDESVIVAQLLYAGSIADAEYRSDWAEALIRCMRSILVLAIVSVILIGVLYWFFGTEYGASLRATGNNLNMSRAQGINTDLVKIAGLVISNGIVAFAGALLAQYQGNADVNMGKGAIVIGLAAVIIGEALFGWLSKNNFALKLLTVVFGGIIYFIVYSTVLFIGLDTNYLKMLSALVVAIFLAVPYWKKKYVKVGGHKKQQQKGAEKNA